MRVVKYIPEKLYGFVVGEDELEVFFHLGSFVPGQDSAEPTQCRSCPANDGCAWRTTPAPPILGESVEVHLDLDGWDGVKAPRALKVLRSHLPTSLSGVVETFDAYRGFGFIKTRTGDSYHLHKSEVVEGRLPLAGQRVSFYGGMRLGKPRACHVRMCP